MIWRVSGSLRLLELHEDSLESSSRRVAQGCLASDKFLAAADISVRHQLATLIRSLDRPDLLPYLEAMLRDPRLWEGADTSLLNAVSWAIASTGEPESIRKVIETAAHADSVLQNALALGLACLNSPKAAPMLASIVTGGESLSTNRFAFLLAIKLLGQIPETRSIPLLQRLQDNPDQEVATWSADALKSISRVLEEFAAASAVSKNN